MARILSDGQGHRLRRLFDGFIHRLYMVRSRRQADHREMNRRRDLVRAHITQAIDHLRNGQAIPPQPETGSPKVDEKLQAFLTALEDQYPRGRTALRLADRSAS